MTTAYLVALALAVCVVIMLAAVYAIGREVGWASGFDAGWAMRSTCFRYEPLPKPLPVAPPERG